MKERSTMHGSFRYGFKSRFYGVFSQLPWSLVVTAIVLLPVAYYSNTATRVILIQLTIYWALAIGVLLLLKDLYVQRYLFEFSVQGREISVYKNSEVKVDCQWQQLKAIRAFNKKDKISRQSIESNGVLLKFEDGFELPVFERVSDYDKFSSILTEVTS